MENEFIVSIQGILVDLVVGLFVIGLYYMLSCFKAWVAKMKVETSGIKDENFKKLIDAALGRLDGIAELTVAGIEGKIGKELREQVKQGKVDREKLLALSEQAFKQIVDMLEPQYEEVLRESIGDLDTYIDNLIEAKLEQIKLGSIGGGRALTYGY